MIKYI